MTTLAPARTYNQNHIPRKYTAGRRRLSIYWTWSYLGISNATRHQWRTVLHHDRGSQRALAGL